jgi:hypothetical protein
MQIMKKKIAFLVSFFVAVFSFGQTAEKWQQVYGGTGDEYGFRVRTCLDQGYIVAGSTASNGPTDGYLVRTDSLGLVMWIKYFAGNNIDVLRSIRQLPDSGYIICGYSNSQGNGGYDGWVLRTDKNGDTLWTKYIGTTDWDFFYDVTPTYDNKFILVGGTYGLGNGNEDMWIVKIDSLGNFLWQKTYGGIKQDEARSIAETDDSLIAAVGFSCSLGDTLGDSWILRMRETNGDTIWTRTLGQAAENKAWGVADMSVFGRICVVGEITISNDLNSYIAVYNFAGAQVIYSTFGIAGPDIFNGVVVTPSGNTAVIGSTENDGGGNGDLFLFRDYGTWGTTTIGTTSREDGYSIDYTHDRGYIICGYTEGFNSILPNLYLVKTDTLGGSSVVLGIREQSLPLSYAGISISPNPAANETTVFLDFNEDPNEHFSAKIYDLSGREISDIPFSQFQFISSKTYSVSIETAFLENGIYQFVVSDSSGKKSCGKFVVSH